ncbi:hypothetical protein [Schlesneria paludicola]|uniref:hypothetical protein n=1 Tax=Schlesneria paludicola TaxID=360056 RepID=UPI00029B00D1|nr:hypothetical protein [Schlesneria paludicola]
MWWKFWTWFRHEDTSKYITKAPRKVRSVSGVPSEADRNEPEDILGSISELIEDHAPDTTEFVQPARIVEPVQAIESVPIVEPTAPKTARLPERAADIIQQTSRPPEFLLPTNVEPPPTAKPTREPSTIKRRDESQNDARQTLVADDILKALSERFKDFDKSDEDEDRDGPSPYQTIVPNDD